MADDIVSQVSGSSSRATILDNDPALKENSNVSSKPNFANQRSLSDHLGDPTLIRGIKISTMVNDFGRAFKTSTGNISLNKKDYNKSFEVKRLDYFLSHEWSGDRLAKTLALLYFFNSRAASVASIFTAAVCAILQLEWVACLDRGATVRFSNGGGTISGSFGIWCSILCPVVFFVTFVFWQRIKNAFHCSSDTVFLDKFCVDQVHERRKMEAVMGLAGFLRVSDQLIILWTPRYFSRLWCVFEVASWVHLEKPAASFNVVPVAHVFLIFASVPAVSMYWISDILLQPVLSISRDYLSIALISFWMLAFVSAVLKSNRELISLPQQLSKFSVSKAKCFCCTNNHILPDTGKPIPCDRLMVYDTLAKWFVPQPSSDEELANAGDFHSNALDSFDKFIQEELASVILDKAGCTHILYREVLIGCLPQLWRAFDVLAAIGSVQTYSLLRELFFEYLLIYLLILPLIYKCVFIFIPRLSHCMKRSSCKKAVYILVLGTWLWGAMILFFLYFAAAYLNRLASMMPVVLYSLSLVTVLAILNKHGVQRFLHAQNSHKLSHNSDSSAQSKVQVS